MEKHASQEIQDTNGLLQAVFDSAPNGIAVMKIIYDEKGKVDDFTILLFNAFTINWIGQTDYRGKRYSEVFPMVKETGILDKFKEVAETGVNVNFERWYDGEGMGHWFRFSAVKQDELLVVTTEDITERKQAEEAIRQSDERFRFALKAGHLGSWELNLATFALNASDHCKLNFGQPIDQPFSYETLRNCIHPEDRQRQEEAVNNTILTGKDYDIEYRVIWPDRSIHWVNVRGQLYYGKEGKPDFMIGVSLETTQRKQAEIALAHAWDNSNKQQRLYEAVTNNTPDLIYVFDLKYRFTYANDALLSMWGKTGDQAIGKGLRENGYEEWHALMHEREIDVVVSTKKSVRGTVSFPHAILGKRIYDYIFAPVMNENGDVEAIAGSTRDITELKRAEERLQHSEARFRNMVERAPVAILLSKGEDVVIESVNVPMLHFMNKTSSDEVLGKKMLDVLPELAGQPALQTVIDVQKTGIPYRVDEQPVDLVINGKLQRRYFNFSYDAIKEADGRIAVLHMAIDVTEQVMTRRKIEESESRFRALVNATSNVVYRMNADWTEMRQLEGRGFLAETGEPITNWIEKYIDFKDREKVKEAILQAIAGKSTFEMEHQVINAENSLGWTFSRAVPILDNNGNILEWFGSASDVTERKKSENAVKESEQTLRNLILQSPVGICVLDAGTLVSEVVNKKFVEIAGKPYEAIMGKHYWDTFAEAAPYYEVALQDVIDKGESFYANEVQLMLIRHGVEETIFVTFVYEPLKDLHGIVKKVVVWVLDNTPQVQARRRIEESENRYKILTESLEHQVNERTKELQRSNEDLQQFAHVASHDLKEPVRKIKTFISRLEQHLDGKLDETATRYLERIHIATNRMFTMIEGVLTYSTINATTQIPQRVDLNEIMKNIETDLEIVIQKTNTSFQYNNLPIIQGAPVLLYQLFYNLVNNSIKFANEGLAPRISVTSEVVMIENKQFVKVILSDNGIGFEDAQRESIFDTFTRLNSKDRFEGTGLGLSLCRKIVERHDGNISAIGILGVGATFTILLPTQQNEERI